MELVSLCHLIENLEVLLRIHLESKVFRSVSVELIVNSERPGISCLVITLFDNDWVMLQVIFVDSLHLFAISVDSPVSERHFKVSAREWDHSIVVALESEVKISFLLMSDHSVVVLKPALPTINIVPVSRVTLCISVVSNLPFIKAPKEFSFVNEEDSIFEGSPRIYSMRNLFDILWGPDITCPSSSSTGAAVVLCCEVIIVIAATLIWISVIPIASVTILIFDIRITITEGSTPFASEVLVGQWIS